MADPNQNIHDRRKCNDGNRLSDAELKLGFDQQDNEQKEQTEPKSTSRCPNFRRAGCCVVICGCAVCCSMKIMTGHNQQAKINQKSKYAHFMDKNGGIDIDVIRSRKLKTQEDQAVAKARRLLGEWEEQWKEKKIALKLWTDEDPASKETRTTWLEVVHIMDIGAEGAILECILDESDPDGNIFKQLKHTLEQLQGRDCEEYSDTRSRVMSVHKNWVEIFAAQGLNYQEEEQKEYTLFRCQNNPCNIL